ncbi:MAG: FMN-binding protein [Candidatus Nanopelagicales bacterium]
MKRILLWLLTTVTIVVLLFGYRTSTMGAIGGDTVIATGGDLQPSAQESTVTGSSAQTQWGPVQVQITVSGSQITDVQVLEYPSDNPKDQQINNYALPILVSETLDAQSADIDMVSGATVTSVGYLQSLQAALDEAGLG